MVYGFILVFGLLYLGYHIALNKVEQNTSYGLDGIVTALGLLTQQFATWAYGNVRSKDEVSER